jgi:2-polyprenyl-3-methyl-5-hydroxy-6-metoxy-1,4-benzoquinol methylase
VYYIARVKDEQKPSCPICGYKKSRTIIKQKKFSIVECLSCNLRFVWPQPEKKKLIKVYAEKYFFGNTHTPKGYANYAQLEQELLKEAKKRLGLIKEYSHQKNLLDIGCSTGVFLEEAKKQGYRVAGNEISPYALKKLKQKKIVCFSGAVENGVLPKGRFDIITAWDVIEHISEIKKTVKEIENSLKTGGYLFITTPNAQSLDSLLTGKSWYNYQKAPEHLLFLNKKSVSKLFENSKLKVVSIKPWGFYRNLSFFIGRLQMPSLIANSLLFILNFLQLSNSIVFFPFTDFMIIARKIST